MKRKASPLPLSLPPSLPFFLLFSSLPFFLLFFLPSLPSPSKMRTLQTGRKESVHLLITPPCPPPPLTLDSWRPILLECWIPSWQEWETRQYVRILSSPLSLKCMPRCCYGNSLVLRLPSTQTWCFFSDHRFPSFHVCFTFSGHT